MYYYYILVGDTMGKERLTFQQLNEESWKQKIITPRVASTGIVESPDRKYILLVDRIYQPFGFAFPGGMQELGETIEETIVREVYEETNIEAESLGMLYMSSNPYSDPRWHVDICYFVMKALEFKKPIAGDDAKEAFWYPYDSTKYDIAFVQATRNAMELYRTWRMKPNQDLFKIDRF